MKFAVGQVVRTVKGSVHEVEGPIHQILQPSKDIQRLWGNKEPHYLIKDIRSGEFISVIERGLEKV